MGHQAHGTPDHGQEQPHPHSGSHDQGRVLDLDAEVFGDSLAAVLDVAGVAAARAIVDLGAGTGTGSRLLRARYPGAAVTCVDNDPRMLEALRGQGFDVVEADLDDGFPAPAGPAGPSTTAGAEAAPLDLVWASSSLHHVSRPDRLLSGIRRALAPGGVLVVVELAALPRFLSDPCGALLEQRCHTAAAAEGWNQHPDWTPALEAAGFRVTRHEVTTAVPVTTVARDYAREWFDRFSHLAALSAEDRTAVAEWLEQFSGDIVLEPRTTRTVWVATAGPSRGPLS